MIEIFFTYHFYCDWPDCLQKMVLQEDTLLIAKDKARKVGWTFTHGQSKGFYGVRCRNHSFLSKPKMNQEVA